MQKLKIGIVGYGKIGHALEKEIVDSNYFEIVAIFSSRKIMSTYKTKVVEISNVNDYKKEIDVIFNCCGSAKQYEEVCYNLSANFNCVDIFDNHNKIKEILPKLDKLAKNNKKITLFAFGWDPGILSMIRCLNEALFNNHNTFWGRGISQGHTNALKGIRGVIDAVQFTIPNTSLLRRSKTKVLQNLDNCKKHRRLCFVVKSNEVSKKQICDEIINLKDYFAGYKTTVKFVSQNKLNKIKFEQGHKGYVIGGNENLDCVWAACSSFQLKMSNNASFTAHLMIVGARAVRNLIEKNEFGTYTILDIPPKYFLENSNDYLRLL